MKTCESSPVVHSVSDPTPPRLFKMMKIVKGDVDFYLGLSHVVDYDGFDVLDYWKPQSTSYPALALMARDILAILVTYVASESAFSVGADS
ncbi:putative AC transposase [Bienertia sinuspersici]